jgi:hypothetical protein
VLTLGDRISVSVRGQAYRLQVVALVPGPAASLVDTDLTVEFDAPSLPTAAAAAPAAAVREADEKDTESNASPVPHSRTELLPAPL